MKILARILVIALFLLHETAASALVAQPADDRVACTAEAKMCPDGSAVSRTGPNCEFAPCPGESADSQERRPYPGPPTDTEEFSHGNPGPGDGGNVIEGGGMIYGTPGGGVVVSPVEPLPLPDEPLQEAAAMPVGVKFLVEHRSAFNGQRITVRGIAIYVLPPEQACPSNGPCAEPRIVLSDSDTVRDDPRYDLTVLLSQTGDFPYKLGQTVDVTGTVSAGADSVTLRP